MSELADLEPNAGHRNASKASPRRVYQQDRCTIRQECPWRAETPTELRRDIAPEIVTGPYAGQFAYVWPNTPVCWLCRCELSYTEVWPEDSQGDT